MNLIKFRIKKIMPSIFRRNKCSHMDQIQEVTPSAEGCEDCLKTGDKWVHLRLCLICGHVGCCDNSKNKHATGHYEVTGHPIIQSFEPDENWRWCYIEKVMLPED
jgi:uncharacterized UBP type Zn finger protein